MKPLPVLLLHGDAEASLLAGAEGLLQAVILHRTIEWKAAWCPRADMLAPEAPPPPPALRARGLVPDEDPRALLEAGPRLVLLPLLPSVTVPLLRHRDGGAFLMHPGLRAGWSAAEAEAVDAECERVAPLEVGEAAAALEPVIESLQARGAAVAIVNAFRHVREPLAHRRPEGPTPLRDRVRQVNLEAARLSRKTGCFVLDVDRPLAQEGGAALGADCFGGQGRASELVADELLGLVYDALPDEAMPGEES